MHSQEPKLAYSLFSPPPVPIQDMLLQDTRPVSRASGSVLLRALLMPRRGHTRLSGKQVSLNILFGGLDDTISPIRIQEAGVGDSQWKHLIPSRSGAVGVGGKAGRK